MTQHEITTQDMTISGNPGTVATCSCGWESVWGIRDGSAEAEAHAHKEANDAEYRATVLDRIAAYNADLTARGCICEHLTTDFGFVQHRDCPLHAPKVSAPVATPVMRSQPCHTCTCHLSAPCGECENCGHDEFVECDTDCQECEIDHF